MAKVNTNKDIPWLIKSYLVFYDAIPRVYFPGTKVDFGFLLFWIALFVAIRGVSLPFFFASGWPEGNVSTLDAVASFVGGCFHGPQVVALSFALLAWQKPYNPSAISKDHPKWWNDAADATLQLCTAYMTYDFFFLVWTRRVPGQGIVLDSDAIMYMVHHFMTAFYMTTSRLYRAGLSATLTCIFLGEFTNTPFNICFIHDMAKRVGLVFSPFYAQFVPHLEFFNAGLYVLFRAVLSPLVLSYVSYTLLVDKIVRDHLPMYMRLIWISMKAAVVYGSMNQVILFFNLIKGQQGSDITDQDL